MAPQGLKPKASAYRVDTLCSMLPSHMVNWLVLYHCVTRRIFRTEFSLTQITLDFIVYFILWLGFSRLAYQNQFMFKRVICVQLEREIWQVQMGVCVYFYFSKSLWIGMLLYCFNSVLKDFSIISKLSVKLKISTCLVNFEFLRALLNWNGGIGSTSKSKLNMSNVTIVSIFTLWICRHTDSTGHELQGGVI